MMESNEKLRLRRVTLAAVLLAGSVLSTTAYAADEPAEEKKEIVVQGSLGALPLKDVGTIFGFNKNLVETPRSASTISKEQMERFGALQNWLTPGSSTPINAWIRLNVS